MRRLIGALFLSGIMVFVFSGCGSKESGTSVTVTEAGNVEGIATSASTGAALSDVTVQIGDKSSLTSSTGVYSLKDIETGSRTITAAISGYENYSGSVTIAKGTTVTFDIQLTPTASSGDTTAPSVPTNVTATSISSSQINLSWTASTDNTGVSGYEVYRAGILLKTATGTSISDTGLSAATQYCYTILAYDAAGNKSAQSSSQCATTSASSSASGLVAYYPFTGNAKDASGNGNDGTVHNATLTSDNSGQANSAYHFPGLNGYISVPSNAALNTITTTKALTVSAWIYVEGWDTDGWYFPVAAIEDGWELMIIRKSATATTGYITLGMSGTGTGDTGTTVSMNAWHHVTASFDDAGNSVCYYLDGTSAGCTTYTNAMTAYTQPLNIAFNPYGTDNYSVGSIDEVRIYNTALTAAEVSEIYTNSSVVPDTTAPSVPSGLAAATAASAAQINLTWNASTDTGANASGVAGYEVYRDGTIITTTTSTSYLDTSLTASTQYCYTVLAYDVAGNKSAQSSSQCATTSAPTPTLAWTYLAAGGVESFPAIGADGTIYVGSGYLSSSNVFYAINPNGTLKWSYATGGNVDSSPSVADDGTIYVGSEDGKLYAFNPDGTLKWSYSTGNIVWSSPAIGTDGVIYVGSYSGKILALNTDGTLKWSYTTTGAVAHSSPSIAKDGTIYVGTASYILYAMASNGTKNWQYSGPGPIYSNPAIDADGTIYVCSGSALLAMNPDGTLKWSYTAGASVAHSDPTIGTDGSIYFGSDDDYVYAVNASGSLKWKYLTGGDANDPSTVVCSDGTVIAGSADKNLYGINPDGTLAWSYLFGGGPLHANIGSDGTVYVGATDSKVYAIQGVCSGLAATPWPTFHGNAQHTGRAK